MDAFLNYIHGKQLADGQPRGYVGSLKFNRKLEDKGRIVKAAASAASIAPELRKPLREGERPQWYFTCTLRLPDVQPKVRLVILWQQQHDAAPRIILVTNRVCWEVSRIVRTYRQRWTGTETFPREGQQPLGRGDCQLRDGEGQTRPRHLVMLAYRLWMQQLQQGPASEWAYRQLTTLGEACRALLGETLRQTLTWAMERSSNPYWTKERVSAHLGLS